MSRFIDFTLPSTVPGRTLHGFRCVPEGQVRAVLQLSHGMVEYIDRYRPLAEYLADRGILVTGHDHLGHGASIRTKEDYGYFAEPDGNRAVLADLHAVTVLTKELYPNLPYFLLGHSMGSFYARQYLCEYGRELNGAIIMGTGFQPKALVKVAKTLCRVLAAFHGWHYRSSLVANLSFMGYNKGLEGRTTHDWLNRDQAEVDGFVQQIGGWLVDRGVKMVVIACNTATAAALRLAQQVLDVPVIGVIAPGARAAINSTRTRRVGVLATNLTIRSGAYTRAIQDLDAGVDVYGCPASSFVEVVEHELASGAHLQEQWLENEDIFDTPAVRALVGATVEPLRDHGIDTVVLLSLIHI